MSFIHSFFSFYISVSKRLFIFSFSFRSTAFVQIGPVVDHTTLSKDGHFVAASSNVTGRKTGDKAILLSPLHDSTVAKEGELFS